VSGCLALQRASKRERLKAREPMIEWLITIVSILVVVGLVVLVLRASTKR
jgi:hypothetical protein